MKTIVSSICLAASSLTTPLFAADTPAPVTQPNIVIIYIDDMGYADIGPFFDPKEGPKGYTTPNLDRMAAEGMKFTSFYSAQPICSASRASLLTGCYANRVGFSGAIPPHNKWGISSNEMTIAQVCKEKGYATAIFGKWHLGDAMRFLPLQHGFDEYFGLPYSNDMTPHPRWPGERYNRNKVKLPLINQNTVVNPDVGDAAQNMLTTWYTEHAVSFINRHKNQPFFLYVPHSMVHVPLHVSDKFRGKTKRGLFGDVVEEVDWSVGQILGAIKADGLDDKTLVMFCSDNGPWLVFGDHAGSAYPFREGKLTCWDGGVHEPTIMRWPGHIPAGRVCDAPLCTIDMLPTIAKLIGAPLPPHKIDGLDISDVILGKTDESPHDALFFYNHHNDLEALRSGKWKLEFPRSYKSLDGRPGGKDGRPARYSILKLKKTELFDLDADPGEQHDVSAEHPGVMKRLEAYADRMRADLGDNLTHQKGTGRRPHETITDGSGIYPSDPAFPKAFDDKYRPGLKADDHADKPAAQTNSAPSSAKNEVVHTNAD